MSMDGVAWLLAGWVLGNAALLHDGFRESAFRLLDATVGRAFDSLRRHRSRDA